MSILSLTNKILHLRDFHIWFELKLKLRVFQTLVQRVAFTTALYFEIHQHYNFREPLGINFWHRDYGISIQYGRFGKGVTVVALRSPWTCSTSCTSRLVRLLYCFTINKLRPRSTTQQIQNSLIFSNLKFQNSFFQYSFSSFRNSISS